jgi:hypothetical protein
MSVRWQTQRKSNAALRASVRLARADDSYVVWSETHDRPFFRLISSHLGVEALIQVNALLKGVMASTAWVSVPRKSDSDTADEGDEGYISSSV